MINIGCTHRDQNDIEPAVTCFRQAMDINPAVYNSYLNLSDILINRGDYQQAVEVLEKGVRAIPQNDKLQFQLATAYFKMGRLDDARRVMEICLRLNPRDPSYQRAYRQILEGLKK